MAKERAGEGGDTVSGPRIAFLLDLARRLADQPQTTGLTRVEWADVAEALESHQRLAAALKGLVADIEALMEDTEGVKTTDGDGMPYTMDWGRMLPGGKYEYLTHWNDARAALARVKGGVKHGES